MEKRIVIYYDATRLLHRSKAATPTGIDRVDINYAYHFLINQNSYDVKFIFQEKNIFFLLEEHHFVEKLYKKWILSEVIDFDFGLFFSKIMKTTQKLTASKYINDISKKIELSDPKNIDGGLLDEIIANHNSKGFYINTSHHGVGNTDAYQIFKVLGNLKIIFYLHDTIPIDYPEYVREGDEITHSKRVKAMSDYGDYILVNSQYTKDRLNHFWIENGLRPKPCSIMYIGVEDQFLESVKNIDNFKINKDLINEDYFVYISTIEPRKNHLLLLHLWRQMIIEGIPNIPKLIILGKRGWNNQNILDLLDRSVYLKKYIVELSNLSDEHMLSILKNSKALLYPSFVEGWGMPIVEAIAARVPVICSDIPAHRESGQNLVKYISLNDTLSWQHTILNLSNPKTSEMERSKLINRYSSYKYPKWEEHFEYLFMILDSFNFISSNPVTIKKNADITDTVVSFYRNTQSTLNDRSLSSSNNSNNSMEYGLFSKLILSLIIKLFKLNNSSNKTQKLIRKFQNNPILFLKDSKIKLLRMLGNELDIMLRNNNLK